MPNGNSTSLRSPSWKKKKGEALRHCNAVIREVFNVEPDEVKMEVDRRRNDGYFSKEEGIKSDGDGAVGVVEQMRRSKIIGLQRKVPPLL